MNRLFLFFFLGCTYPLYSTLGHRFSHVCKTSFVSSPVLTILVPAYLLYSDHYAFGNEPLSPSLNHKIRVILAEIGYNPADVTIELNKLELRSLPTHSLELMKTIIPLQFFKENIVIVPTAHGLFVNEQLCNQLTDKELRSYIIPCAFFIKNKTLEKSIISALITPIATDYGIRAVTFFIDLFVATLCDELAERYPLLSSLLCSSNIIIDLILTNIITKFILNGQLVQYFNKRHLAAIAKQSQKFLQNHAHNSYPFSRRSSENSGGRSYRTAGKYY